jgi:hypothetical protein
VPTYEALPSFWRDFGRLTSAQQAAFFAAVDRFVADLKQGRFRAGLRVKGVRIVSGVFEMTWAPDGRATFHFGEEKRPGEPHGVWRRVGRHEVLGRP